MSPIKDPHLELVIVIFIVPFIVNVSTESSATKGRTLEPKSPVYTYCQHHGFCERHLIFLMLPVNSTLGLH